MAVTLLPRMSRIAVDTILGMKQAGNTLGPIRQRLESMPNAASIGETGGSLATDRQLRSFASAIENIARANGYPESRGDRAQSSFDAQVTIYLAESQMLSSGEVLRDDIWAFISTWLLQEFTEWRFGLTPARYHGGVRNAFQRLWLRGRALDRGDSVPERWGLIEALTEDAFVQIIERPSIGGDSRLASALAEGWIRCSVRIGRSAMEPIMRRATIGIRIRNQVLALSAISTSDLATIVDEEFDRATRATGVLS